MKFGWINAFGASIVVFMMIPNLVYAIRNKGEQNLCISRFANIIEQLGRYACIVLMWVPLFVWSFGFASVAEMILYILGNAVLLTAYWIVFGLYMKKKSARRALTLAIIPSCIFLFSGILLRHWLLVGFAALFAVGHIFVTYKNVEKTGTYISK